MQFDIRKALADRDQRRSAIERRMFDIPTERRLLAALVADDAIENRPPFTEHRVSAMAICEDLAVDDFAVGQHREVFSVLRGQSAMPPYMAAERLPEQFDLVDVFEAVQRRDKLRESCAADTVSLVWLFDLVTLEPRVTVTWVRCACNRLRELANHRRMA